MQSTIRPLVSALAAAACVSEASAQFKPQLPGKFPSKAVRLVVATGPGGGTDFTTRLIVAHLAERWNHPFVIENRGGASGVIAAEMVARSTPDGYTILSAPSSVLVNLPLLSKVSYDVVRDFSPISRLTSAPYLLAATASLPVNSVRDLVNFARNKPGGITYATSGAGTSAHLASELLKAMANIPMVHVAYKGTGPALTDLVGGHVQIQFGGVTSMIPLAKQGKLKALAITSLHRSRFNPDIPTVAEQGYPGFEVTGWYSFSAPAGVQPSIILALNKEITQILSMPDVQEKFANDGAEVAPGTPAQFKDAFVKELAKWSKVIKEAGLKM